MYSEFELHFQLSYNISKVTNFLCLIICSKYISKQRWKERNLVEFLVIIVRENDDAKKTNDDLMLLYGVRINVNSEK